MKRLFKRNKGDLYDGDEDYIHFLEEYLLDYDKNNLNGCPNHRKNWRIEIIITEDRLGKK